MFLKPNVTRVAADRYGYTFDYQPKPNWSTYAQLLDFVAVVRRNLTDLAPRDMIDMQSFLWVKVRTNIEVACSARRAPRKYADRKTGRV
jgi:hypothetical protein